MIDRLRRLIDVGRGTFGALVMAILLQSAAQAALVQYWTFDNDTANAVATGNTATLVGAVGSEFTAAVPSALAHSTGSVLLTNPASAPLNQWINLGNIGQKCSNAPYADDATVTTHGLTVSFWFNANSLNNDMRLFGPTMGDANVSAYRVMTDPAAAPDVATMQMYPGAGGTWQNVSATVGIKRGQWHHVAYTYVGQSLTVYLDGVPSGGTSNAFPYYSVEEVALAGRFRNQYGQHFDGYFDDVAIWDTALTPAAIAQLAGGTAPTEIVERTEQPEYSQVVNVDFDFTRVVGDVSYEFPAYEGRAAIAQSGTTWNVAEVTGAGGDARAEAIDMVDSQGSASGISFYTSGNDFGYNEAQYYPNSNRFMGDRLIPARTTLNEWQIDGLEVGATYDLYFYGFTDSTGAVFDLTSGAAPQSASLSPVTGARMYMANEDPEDWVEGMFYTVMTFTAEASTVTGAAHPQAPNMGWAGVQIAKHGSATAALPGDLNGDGMVGSADLDIVRGNWGQSVPAGCLSCGDPSGDGSVGSADLDIVRANWGATAPAAVPEPGLLTILILGGLSMLFIRARKTRRFACMLVAICLFGGSSAGAAELVQYWTFDDPQWTYAAQNQVPGGAVGTLNSFVGDEWTTDVPAALSHSTGALEFKSDFMQWVNFGDINLSAGTPWANADGATISFWFKPDVLTADMRMFQAYDSDTAAGYLPAGLHFHSATVGEGEGATVEWGIQAWGANPWKTTVPTGSIESGQWHHLAMTYKDNVATTYLNGQETSTALNRYFDFILTTVTPEGGDPRTYNEFTFGGRYRNSHGTFFDGVLDDMAIWNAALPAATVAQLAAGTNPASITVTDSPAVFDQFVNIDFTYGSLGEYDGNAVFPQAGTVWNEAPVGGARKQVGAALSGALDSEGAATGIGVSLSGFEFGYAPGPSFYANVNPVDGDRVYAHTGTTNEWEITGLTPGETYEIVFLASGHGLISLTAGADPTSAGMAWEYNNAFRVRAEGDGPCHWEEQMSWTSMTVTPTSSTISGVVVPSPEGGQTMSLSGLQIAKYASGGAAVPEPGTWFALLCLVSAVVFSRRR